MVPAVQHYAELRSQGATPSDAREQYRRRVVTDHTRNPFDARARVEIEGVKGAFLDGIAAHEALSQGVDWFALSGVPCVAMACRIPRIEQACGDAQARRPRP